MVEEITRDKIIATPGPVPIVEECKNVLYRIMHPYYQSEFREIYLKSSKIIDRLVDNDGYTVMFSGGGVLSLEAALRNLAKDDSRVLVLSGGFFGDLAAIIAKKIGMKVSIVELPVDGKVDYGYLREEIRKVPDIDIAIMVHCETSTGVLFNLREIIRIVKEEKNPVIIVDSISSFLAEEISMSKWGIDVLLASSPKTLGLPPGLSIVSLSKNSLEKLGDSKSFYLDFLKWIKAMEGESEWPSTPPVGLILALYLSLKKISTNYPKFMEMHRNVSKIFKDFLRDLNFKINPLINCCSTLTVAKHPVISSSEIFRKLYEEYNILVAKGLPPLADYIRIGHMSYGLSREYIETVLKAIYKIVKGSRGFINRNFERIIDQYSCML